MGMACGGEAVGTEMGRLADRLAEGVMAEAEAGLATAEAEEPSAARAVLVVSLVAPAAMVVAVEAVVMMEAAMAAAAKAAQ